MHANYVGSVQRAPRHIQRDRAVINRRRQAGRLGRVAQLAVEAYVVIPVVLLPAKFNADRVQNWAYMMSASRGRTRLAACDGL